MLGVAVRGKVVKSLREVGKVATMKLAGVYKTIGQEE